MNYGVAQTEKVPAIVGEFVEIIFRDYPHKEQVNILNAIKNELLKARQALEKEKAENLELTQQDFNELCKGNAALSQTSF